MYTPWVLFRYSWWFVTLYYILPYVQCSDLISLEFRRERNFNFFSCFVILFGEIYRHSIINKSWFSLVSKLLYHKAVWHFLPIGTHYKSYLAVWRWQMKWFRTHKKRRSLALAVSPLRGLVSLGMLEGCEEEAQRFMEKSICGCRNVYDGGGGRMVRCALPSNFTTGSVHRLHGGMLEERRQWTIGGRIKIYGTVQVLCTVHTCIHNTKHACLSCTLPIRSYGAYVLHHTMGAQYE